MEERWTLWLFFDCINFLNHPDARGVAVLTNYFYAPKVIATIEERICSICGFPLIYIGEETALTPFLQHDFERIKKLGYNPMKDEEII